MDSFLDYRLTDPCVNQEDQLFLLQFSVKYCHLLKQYNIIIQLSQNLQKLIIHE